MSLKMRVERQAGALPCVHLIGSIDEHARIEEVLSTIQEESTLDLSQIERINSVGLISWLKWMVHLTSKQRISVNIISYCLTTYANQLLDLFGSAKVKACMAPYYCPSCKTNIEVAVSADDVRASKDEPPPKPCPTCRSPMDFDEMDQYFAFLRGQA